MRTTVSWSLYWIITEQWGTLHVPTVHFTIQTFTSLALIRPTLAVHQYHIRQLLMFARQLSITLGATLILTTTGNRTVASRLPTRYNAIVTLAAPAWLTHWRHGLPMLDLGPFKYTAKFTIRTPTLGAGTPKPSI